jgi:hypothetical protein
MYDVIVSVAGEDANMTMSSKCRISKKHCTVATAQHERVGIGSEFGDDERGSSR